jgi:hypothetical protein
MEKPDDGASHSASLAVWDVTSPMTADRGATLNVGASCPAGCDLTGAEIEIRSETGSRLGGGQLRPDRWPGTRSLYWTALDVLVPPVDGTHTWSLHLAAPASEQPHESASCEVHVVVAKPPEHTVTLEVVEQATGLPVEAVEVRLGIFRAATDGAGTARLEVPGGTYDVAAWKIGYELLSRSEDVRADRNVRLEIRAEPPPEQPYWM